MASPAQQHNSLQATLSGQQQMGKSGFGATFGLNPNWDMFPSLGLSSEEGLKILLKDQSFMTMFNIRGTGIGSLFLDGLNSIFTFGGIDSDFEDGSEEGGGGGGGNRAFPSLPTIGGVENPQDVHMGFLGQIVHDAISMEGEKGAGISVGGGGGAPGGA